MDVAFYNSQNFKVSRLMREFSLIVLSFLLMSFLPSVHAAVGDINTFAGTDRVTFNPADDGGLSIAAQLNWPTDTAVDSKGNIYIVESSNHRIRKVEKVEVEFDTWIITTYAGTGTPGYNSDGIENQLAIDAQLNQPIKIAFDRHDNLFVADSKNHRIRKIAPDGIITTVAGTGEAGFNGDGGSAKLASLFFPLDVAIDAGDNLYIADHSNSRIRKVDTDDIISTVAGSATIGFSGDGDLATKARLNGPNSVAVDAISGDIYIADTNNHRIRKVDASNDYIDTIAGSERDGKANGFRGDGGPAINAQLNSPRSITIANNGRIIIADTNNHRVRIIDTDTDNTIYTIAGTGVSGYNGNGSPATNAQLSSPYGVFVIGATLYIADSANHRVRAFSSNTIATIAGAARITFNGDGGPAIDAQLHAPFSIAFDSLGNRYIVDSDNHRIRKITPDGVISTIAGLEIDGNAAGFSGDDGLAISAQLNFPTDIVIDSNNTLYFADFGNHRIRKITPTTPEVGITSDAIISTIAGSEIDGSAAGFSGDGRTATSAQLNFPTAIAIDSSDNLYIADRNNQRIRKIDINNIITTFAGDGTTGTAEDVGDGNSAITAQLNHPRGIAVDADGNIFVADSFHNRIRKIDNAGVISTIAGTGTASFSGDGDIATAATFNLPSDVTFTKYGNLLILDTNNQRIRHITSDNIITTIAGSGNTGFNGDGGQAENASFFNPFGIAVNDENILYIADSNNNRVRTVVLNTPPSGTDKTITAIEDIARQFSTDDFGFNDVDEGHDTLASIKITSLTAVGTLRLNNVDVTADQVISQTNISRLTFTSALNGNGIDYDSFQFTVNDGVNNSKQNNTITIGVVPVSVNEGDRYNFRVSTTGIENDSTTYSISNKPVWLLFDTANGQLFGTPDNSQVGTYNNITITAHDETTGTLLSTPLPPFSITVLNTNDLPDGDISITGTREEGSILTVNTTLLSDDDGLGPFRYLWLRNGIHVSTNSSYLLGDADVGQTISVIVSYTDRRGTDEIIPEKDAGSITAVNYAPVGSVTITGLPHIGETLTVENTLSDADGLGAFSYEWRRSGTVIPVGTSSSYLLGVADENQTLAITIRYTDGQGTNESITSAPSAQVTAAPPPIQDSDGDGMSDAFETTHGVDDPAGDPDGDGISNLQEFLDGTDPAPPEDFAPPTNVNVNATGILTEVVLGSTTTNDGTDGVLIPQPDNSGPFLPGRHTIFWTATDAAGNSTTATATQTIDVVPMVDFAIDQISEEGTTATVSVHFNGVAPIYPVNIAFNIDGNNPSYTLGTGADGVLSVSDTNVTDSDINVSDSITIALSPTAFDGETITVNMGTLTGAVAGNKTSHTITITERNIAPKVSLTMSQNGGPHTSTVVAITTPPTEPPNVNEVVVTANIVPELTANMKLDWSRSDNALVGSEIDIINNTFTFEPVGLNIGTYGIVVDVLEVIGVDENDNEITKLITSQKHRFKVLVNVPAEGQNNYHDSDGDGIANYLDQIPASYAVALQQEHQSQHIVETQPGLTLRLGAIAFESETNGIQVSETVIERYATSIRFPKDDHQNIGGLFDFEIHGLNQAGDSALVVIPLRKVIPAKPRYRKLMPTGWQDFIVNEKNSLASAPGENGICPPPNDSAYTTGLTSGHHCIQLRLEDGGPNDADGTADGVIIDPGGVAIEPIVNERPPPNVVTPLPDTGGGILNSYLLLILAWLLFFSHRRYKRS